MVKVNTLSLSLILPFSQVISCTQVQTQSSWFSSCINMLGSSHQFSTMSCCCYNNNTSLILPIGLCACVIELSRRRERRPYRYRDTRIRVLEYGYGARGGRFHPQTGVRERAHTVLQGKRANFLKFYFFRLNELHCAQ